MKRFLSTTRASSRHNSLNKRIRVVLIVVVLAVVLGYGVPRVVSVVSSIVMQPVFLVERWIDEGRGSIPTYLRDRSTLQAEKEAADARLIQLEAESAAARLLSGQDISTTTRQADTIPAAVITQSPRVPYDRLVLNQGSDDGVVIGAPVFVSESVVIGTVLATTKKQSVAALVTSPGVESTVYVFGPDIYTTAVGQGGGVLRIGVPQGVLLETGNPVTLPAVGLGVLGSISYVETAPSRPEQYGFVTLPTSLQQLREVFIGKDSLTPVNFETARENVEDVRTNYFEVSVPEGVLIDIPDELLATSTATSTVATTTNEGV